MACMSSASLMTTPAKPQLAAQQPAQDGGRERRRQFAVAVERRQRDVGRHHQPGPRAHGGVKRQELHPAQPRDVVGQDGRAVVRVDGGVAVAGEMLGRGSHAGRLQARHHGGAQLGNARGVAAKGARAYHRVPRVDVDIAHRRIIDVDAHRRQFAPDGAARAARQLRRTRRAQGQVAGKRRRARQRHERAALLIDGDEHRRLAGGGRGALQGGGQRAHLGRVLDVMGAKERHAANVLAAERRQNLGRGPGAQEAQHLLLAEGLFECQGHGARLPLSLSGRSRPCFPG
jgi:hypothetical protein